MQIRIPGLYYILQITISVLLVCSCSNNKETLDLFVLDKKVKLSNMTIQQPVLTELKKYYVKSNGKPFDIQEDTWGVTKIIDDNISTKNIPLTKINEIVASHDAFYYCDAHNNKLPQEYGYTNWKSGGLNHNDFLLVREVFNNNKPLVLESDLLSYPTNPLIVFKIENLANISYKQWRFKYFYDLSEKNVPEHIVKLYNKIMGTRWNYTGHGMIAINNTENIFVLTSKHIKTPPILYTNSEFAIEANVPEKIEFCEWFEFTTTDQHNTLAEFMLDLTEKGEMMLYHNNLPSSFPAIIRNNSKRMYYICGDISAAASEKSKNNNGDLMTDETVIKYKKFKKMYYVPFCNYIFTEFKNNVTGTH